MPDAATSKAEAYRAKAREMRLRAFASGDAAERQIYADMARHYEAMAEQIDDLAQD